MGVLTVITRAADPTVNWKRGLCFVRSRIESRRAVDWWFADLVQGRMAVEPGYGAPLSEVSEARFAGYVESRRRCFVMRTGADIFEIHLEFVPEPRRSSVSRIAAAHEVPETRPTAFRRQFLSMRSNARRRVALIFHDILQPGMNCRLNRETDAQQLAEGLIGAHDDLDRKALDDLGEIAR